MNTMVIGLRPEYMYPGSLKAWDRDNTLYAANMGASLISDTLLKLFNADYIDDFRDVSSLKSKYDTCVLALATHLHPNRDISKFVDFVEKLDIRTVVLSIGISDYDPNVYGDYQLHRSVTRLLDIASKSNKWIGVRGNYSASVLLKKGYKNVVPIGCPTMYRKGKPRIEIRKDGFSKPLVVYHCSMVKTCHTVLKEIAFLGQDFQDQAVFTDSLNDDAELQKTMPGLYGGIEFVDLAKHLIAENGAFFPTFKDWYAFLSGHDFIIGPRLHGCLAALGQEIPAVMTPRDNRGREIAEFYELPTATYEQLSTKTIYQIYDGADFSRFNELYPVRFRNYVNFLNENKLEHNLGTVGGKYELIPEDQISLYSISQQEIMHQIGVIINSKPYKFAEALRELLANGVLKKGWHFLNRNVRFR